MFILPLASATWRFRESTTRRWFPAIVPGCVHTDLRAAGRIADPFHGTNELDLRWIERCHWEYRTTFHVPSEMMREEVVELVADGLDTVATIFLNGVKIASTENMFVAHRWTVGRQLRRGRNELTIRFRSAVDYIEKTRKSFSPPREFCDSVGNSVRIRKQQCQFGWDWGPRLVTAGIWRDIRLEAWSGNRLAHVHVAQSHLRDGKVRVEVRPELARADRRARFEAAIFRHGRAVVRTTGSGSALDLVVADPELWWPAGQGAQPLYEVVVRAFGPDGSDWGTVGKRIGLRTIVLDQHRDAWGTSFQFVVNGRPIFFKGANWIPGHSFVNEFRRDDYARLLRAAVAANMNGVRLWGGGIYEDEAFYDQCDELGLLVWHDFMFACTLYPADARFVASVREEAVYQVKRTHHHASLALWCGNNEMAQLNLQALRERPALMRGYKRIFHDLLPRVVANHDGATHYWPTSEWRGSFIGGHEKGERSGDSHFWDVWHSRQPVKVYEKWNFRFCSEFGMQSFSSPATNATFCSPGRDNLFGPEMENHQKDRGGNLTVLEYVFRRYRLPSTQEQLIYLAQLNQAYCMKVGVEHFRRLMPRCMGAIYWQFNDCWPATSWSSIEFTGRWKALHYEARRFFAPALVSAHVPGDEFAIIGNYRRTSVREVHLFSVYDGPGRASGILEWELGDFRGGVVLAGKKRVLLRPGESVRQKTLDLHRAMQRHGRDHLVLRLALTIDGEIVSEQTVFLSPPRFLELPSASRQVAVHMLSKQRARLTFSSPVFEHAVAVDFGSLKCTLSDNFFDLFPGRPKEIVVDFEQPTGSERIAGMLRHFSLVDTYAAEGGSPKLLTAGGNGTGLRKRARSRSDGRVAPRDRVSAPSSIVANG